MEDDFEKVFDKYIAEKEYDLAEDALFSVVRSAFRAGWCAARRNDLRDKKTVREQKSNPSPKK